MKTGVAATMWEGLGKGSGSGSFSSGVVDEEYVTASIHKLSC